MITAWDDSPELGPLGSARGLDRVALDVYCRIAYRYGATVTVGKLPADLTACYGTEAPGSRAVPLITVGRGGVTAHHDANSHTSGYTGHDWRDRLGEKTIVVDTRTIPEARIVEFSVRGPMVNVDLAPGMLDTLGPIPSHMATVAEDYLRPYGGTAAAGAEVAS